MSVYLDPQALALLFVQQYLSEQGYSTALTALEQASGITYDDDKTKRGSELMELVYQHVEQQLTASAAGADGDDSPQPSHPHRSRQQMLQQQHDKLREELMLRSAAADFPSEVLCSLGPLPSNLLSVLLWPGEDLVVAGAADGSVRLLTCGDDIRGRKEQNSTNSGDRGDRGAAQGEVWVARLAGVGGVLTLAWHPAVQAGRCSFSGSQDSSQNCLLLAGCMDGSVHVLHAATGRVLASAKPHNKYVVGASWAPALLQPMQPGHEPQRHQQQHQVKSDGMQQQGEQLVATASYDSSCCLLRLCHAESVQGDQQQLRLEVVQQVPFSGYVQDVCFLPPGATGSLPSYHSSPNSQLNTSTISTNHMQSDNTTSSSSVHNIADSSAGATTASGEVSAWPAPGLQLAVAVRGTNCLQVLQVDLLKYSNIALANSGGASNGGTSGSMSGASSASAASSTSGNGSSGCCCGSSPVWNVTAAVVVNMSEAGDSHVSFSAMRLAVSPCSKYLLIATDSPILLVLRLSDWGVVRRLYGLDVDKFHNASVAWHTSSSYVLAGAAHAAVYVYHLGTAKIVAKLQGHTVNVRAIHYDVGSNRLATCSFDKTIKVYREP